MTTSQKRVEQGKKPLGPAVILAIIAAVFINVAVIYVLDAEIIVLPPWVDVIIDTSLISATFYLFFYNLSVRPKAALLYELNNFKSAVGSSSNHIVITDPDGFIIYANKAAEITTGYPVAEMLGRRPSLWGGQMNERFYKNLWHTIKDKKESFRGEVNNRRKNGEAYTADVSISPALDDNGDVKFFVAVERDVSKEKEAYEKIKASESLYRGIIDSTLDGFWRVDEGGHILDVNEAYCRMMGYSRDELLKMKITDISVRTPEEMAEIIKKVKKAGKLRFIAEHRRKGDGVIIFDISASYMEKEGWLFAFLRDVTAEKEIDKAKTEFVSLASHQLRTPPSIINWYTEILLSGDLGKVNTKQKKYIEEIRHSNKRMIEVINSLLNVSRIEFGKFSIEPKPVNIRKLVDETVSDTMKGTTKSLKIKKDYTSGLLKMNADQVLMKIIIGNLLSNAVKYTPEKGTITVSMKEENKNIVFSVKDTGIGIPGSVQPRIFEKLFRADNAREVDPDGTGLGLYIVKNIVEKSGGEIRFGSKEGKGTVFSVSFPSGGMKPQQGNKVLISASHIPDKNS